MTPALLRAAEEVLLMGTDGGLWFASAVDGNAIAEGNPGDVYRSLRRRFDALVREPTTGQAGST